MESEASDGHDGATGGDVLLIGGVVMRLLRFVRDDPIPPRSIPWTARIAAVCACWRRAMDAMSRTHPVMYWISRGYIYQAGRCLCLRPPPADDPVIYAVGASHWLTGMLYRAYDDRPTESRIISQSILNGYDLVARLMSGGPRGETTHPIVLSPAFWDYACVSAGRWEGPAVTARWVCPRDGTIESSPPSATFFGYLLSITPPELLHSEMVVEKIRRLVLEPSCVRSGSSQDFTCLLYSVWAMIPALRVECISKLHASLYDLTGADVFGFDEVILGRMFDAHGLEIITADVSGTAMRVMASICRSLSLTKTLWGEVERLRAGEYTHLVRSHMLTAWMEVVAERPDWVNAMRMVLAKR